VAQQLKSVAFPLIGCGLFGLDEKMLILQSLDAIEEFDDRLTEGEELHVWLVIRGSDQLEAVVGTFFDLLVQARSKMVSVRLKPIGVPILDLLRYLVPETGEIFDTSLRKAYNWNLGSGFRKPMANCGSPSGRRGWRHIGPNGSCVATPKSQSNSCAAE
jgi:hypothetical protein